MPLTLRTYLPRHPFPFVLSNTQQKAACLCLVLRRERGTWPEAEAGWKQPARARGPPPSRPVTRSPGADSSARQRGSHVQQPPLSVVSLSSVSVSPRQPQCETIQRENSRNQPLINFQLCTEWQEETLRPPRLSPGVNRACPGLQAERCLPGGRLAPARSIAGLAFRSPQSARV